MNAAFTKTIVGHSVQGRAIEAVFCGCDTEIETLDTLFIGVFHGDEGISAELLSRFTTELEAQPPAVPVAIIPVLNPDGLAAGTRVNANKVDLNRNFPAANWQHEGEGTPYFGGASAGSEPETQVVIDLIARYQPKKIVTVHSPYKVINFDGPARALADAMAAHCPYPVVESIGYPTPGSFGTYAGIERQIPVITLELPPGPHDPPHPDQEYPVETLAQIWPDTAKGLLAAITFQEK